MPVNGIIFDERENKAKNWGNIFKNLFSEDGILSGCEVSSTSNTVSVAEGYFVVCGRVIEVDGAASVDLENIQPNGTYKLVFEIDLTKPASSAVFQQGRFIYMPDSDVLIQEDINSNGVVYQVRFASITITAGYISSVTRSLNPISGSKQYTGTLLSAGWTGAAAPYTQTVSLPGVTSSSNVVAGVDFDNADLTARQQARDGWLYAKNVIVNGVTFACDGTKPTVNIPMSFLVVG